MTYIVITWGSLSSFSFRGFDLLLFVDQDFGWLSWYPVMQNIPQILQN